MGKTRPRDFLPIFLTPLFFILCTNTASLLFLPSVSQAGIFSKEKKSEEIAREYGQAVVSITTSDKDGKALGEGSGFIVDPKGIIVTNYHCISGCYTARIRLTNGAYYDVEGVLGVDHDWDIAILRIKAKNLPSAPLGDLDKLSAGERVVAIGNPLGLENTVSEGIISAIRGLEDTGDVVIQFTAPISPGSSGGPLFNAKGEVIGVTTLYLKEGQNLNFAIPINRAKSLIKSGKSVTLAEAAREQKTVSPKPSTPILGDVNPEVQRHFALGVSFIAEGKFDSAISELEEVVKLEPDYAPAYYCLGEAYQKKGQSDVAIKKYKEAIRHNPDHWSANVNLAWLYYEKGLYDLAIVYFKKTKDGDVFGTECYGLGLSYYEKGLYDKAIECLEEAIGKNPDYAMAYFALGVVYGNKGLYDLAIRQYEETLRLKPDWAEAHSFLGDMYRYKGLYDLEIRQYEEAIRLKPDLAEAHCNLGLAYYNKGLYDLAIRQYEETLRLKPDLAEAHCNLGLAYYNKGLYDLAIRQYEEAIRLKPDYVEAHLGLGLMRATEDVLMIGTAIGNFYNDLGKWPIWRAGNAMTGTGSTATAYSILKGPGTDPTAGAGWTTALLTGTDQTQLTNHLGINDPGANGISGEATDYPADVNLKYAWRGPYIEQFRPDPWGNAYLVNVIYLWPRNEQGTNPCYVISAGSNKVIETNYTQAGPVMTVAGDDIVFRIK